MAPGIRVGEEVGKGFSEPRIPEAVADGGGAPRPCVAPKPEDLIESIYYFPSTRMAT
jgi:hypothetical protein